MKKLICLLILVIVFISACGTDTQLPAQEDVIAAFQELQEADSFHIQFYDETCIEGNTSIYTDALYWRSGEDWFQESTIHPDGAKEAYLYLEQQGYRKLDGEDWSTRRFVPEDVDIVRRFFLFDFLNPANLVLVTCEKDNDGFYRAVMSASDSVNSDGTLIPYHPYCIYTLDQELHLQSVEYFSDLSAEGQDIEATAYKKLTVLSVNDSGIADTINSVLPDN